jgi:uncharacterized protein YcgL (UPF0745 family)
MDGMKCKVYQSATKCSRYLIVPSQKSIDNLPEAIKVELSKSKFWKEIDVDSNRPLVALNCKETIENINKSGYHIQEVEILFEEKAGRLEV